MADSASLIEKYREVPSDESLTSAELHQAILKYTPDWSKHDETRNHGSLLGMLEADVPAIKKKMIISHDLAILPAMMNALSVKEEKLVQWVLTLLYDMLREDSSCFSVFEAAMKQQVDFHKALSTLVTRQGVDQYSVDKTAWLLSAVMGHCPRFFSPQAVAEFIKTVQDSNTPCSPMGVLDVIVNALKADCFRHAIWSIPGVADRVTKVSPKTASPMQLCKCIFAFWMLSFEPEGAIPLKEELIIEKIRDVLMHSRVEKVVRLGLTVLRNFLTHKVFAEQVVEMGVLEAVQQLEFEKWRDPELYDDIRDMASQISMRVAEMSNFDRYERELKEGQLKWGFIHSSKFWAENVLKFEQNDFRALKMLAALLDSSDATTLAVACHDLGEFVTMHPLGKKQISKLMVKDKVMELMGSTNPNFRDVRREALLCCQKIMLNKWQDVDTLQKQ